MYGPKFNPAAGLLKTTIVVADGAVAPSVITGDTEAYNAATDTWMELTADPTPRTGSCFGSISSNLYDAGGFLNNGYGGAAATVNEKFNLSKNTWTPSLAAMPQGTMWSASAVYGGRLYCIGGWEVAGGPSINNVQIYQP